MISYTSGNILNGPYSHVMVNPINCAGSMGAGLAAQLRDKYPAMYDNYRRRYLTSGIHIGIPYLYRGTACSILCFPTKVEWRDPSRLEWIDKGLEYLSDNWDSLIGDSILAMPRIGCGLGGLEWEQVKVLIEGYFADHPGKLLVYI